MIALEAVRKAFNQGRDNEYWALNGVDLAIAANQVVVFSGPSGSGKTTLLSLVGALLRPTSGRVRLLGEDISSLPERFLTELRRRRFGFVFQQFNLIRGLTALENVMLPAYPLAPRWNDLQARANGLLAEFGLDQRRGARVEWLSGGEQQRVAICRALINDPDVIIADEPTANLDSALALEVVGLLESLKDRGKTLLMASHDPLVTQSSLVDRVVALRDGRLVGPA